jgi:hypothetical protein
MKFRTYVEPPDPMKAEALHCSPSLAEMQILNTRSAGVTRLLDDFVPCHVGHGRTGDRSSEPVPGLNELVLRPAGDPRRFVLLGA